MHPHKVFLSLGSNLGDRLSQLQQACEEILALPGVHEFVCSSFYETSPVSPLPQPNFINAACSFFTSLLPFELLAHLQQIEKKLGKIPKKKTEPRPIDIDILLFGELSIDIPELKIPHPSMLERLFVLAPLAELTKTLPLPQPDGRIITLNLNDYLKQFKNPHNETCDPLSFVPVPAPDPSSSSAPLN